MRAAAGRAAAGRPQGGLLRSAHAQPDCTGHIGPKRMPDGHCELQCEPLWEAVTTARTDRPGIDTVDSTATLTWPRVEPAAQTRRRCGAGRRATFTQTFQILAAPLTTSCEAMTGPRGEVRRRAAVVESPVATIACCKSLTSCFHLQD